MANEYQESIEVQNSGIQSDYFERVLVFVDSFDIEYFILERDEYIRVSFNCFMCITHYSKYLGTLRSCE